MPLKTFKLLIFHITPIISASVAELCRRAAEYPLSHAAPDQVFKLHAHLCGKHGSADCDTCEIQLRTCCGCTLGNPGRLAGSSSQEATLQAAANPNHSGLGRCQELGTGHHTAPRHPESGPRSLIIAHTLHSSPSVSSSALRSVGKGMQQTLLDTSVYNSCPAPKIEQSDSTHCFAAKIEACAGSKRLHACR